MRRRATGPVLLCAGLVLACLAVLWAASAPRPGPDYSLGVATTTNVPQDALPMDLDADALDGSPPPVGDPADDDGIVGYLVAGLLVLVLAVVAALLLHRLVRALLRAWRERRSVAADDTTAPDLERVATALVVDAEGRRVALRGGTPAEGIVAAWTRLEDSLRSAGLAMPASRVSSETTLAALARFGVDATALTTLDDLYRQASWSSHAMTEDDRARAEAAHDALDAELAAASTRRDAASRA